MIFVLDNYDSFTYNLVQRLGEIDASLDIHVARNDKTSLDEIEQLAPDRIIISPGPCTPAEAGLSKEVIARFGPKLPVLGVCLGHQSVGQALGAKVVRAPECMHGKLSEIRHGGDGLFEALPSPLTATRYHSLILDRDSVPDCFDITAETEDGIVMGIAHKEMPLYGVQFHPESIASEHGHDLLKNFLKTTVH